MKIARFQVGNDVHLGRVDDETIVSLTNRLKNCPRDMAQLIERWDEFRDDCAALAPGADYALADVTLLAPVARPGKILGIGLNYSDHAAEANFPLPEHQFWFSKAATSTNGPYAPIDKPLVSDALDYEAEMVVVIGKRCRHVGHDDVKDVIFGYCVGNDVSVRDWQARSNQIMTGKSFDTHAPFGPWITTADEIDAGNLPIRCFVNGEKRQESNTRNLIFDCATQIEHLSQAMTLEPGDLLFTGTPSGVGALMDPKRFLKVGDRVRVEIDGLGHIENEVIDEIVTNPKGR